MKYKYLLFVFTTTFIRTWAQDSCKIDGVNITAPASIIKTDVEINTLLIEYTYQPPLEMTTKITADVAVVDPADLDNIFEIENDAISNKIIIKAKDDLDIDTYIKHQSVSLSSVSIFITFQLLCGAATIDWFIDVKITDTNNHAPEFKVPSSYSLTLPNPIAPKYDITQLLMDKIIATDLDFTNNDMSFSVDNNKFETDASKEVNKEYRVILRATETFWMPETGTTILITALDQDGKRSIAPASLELKSDPEESVPDIPKFGASYYEFTYNPEPDPGTLTPDTKIIVSTRTSASLTITVTPEGFLDSSVNPVTNEISLKVLKPLPSTTGSVIYTITATKSQTESADCVVIVKIPDDSTLDIPKFEALFYEFTYISEPDPGTLTPDTKIIVSTRTSASLTITVTPEGFLDASFNSVTNEISLEVLKPLPSTPGSVVYTITATKSATESADCVVVVEIPEDSTPDIPKFGASYYEFTYNPEPDPGTLTPDTKIIVSTRTSAPLTITITPEGFLDASFNSVTNEISLKVLKPLPSTPGSVVYTITATKSATESADCVVVVEISEDSTPDIPKFGASYYEFTYNPEPDPGTLTPDTKIIVSTRTSASLTITITPEGFLDASFNSVTNEISLKVLKPLPSTTGSIIYTITATKSATETANCIVVITLSDDSIPVGPSFKQSVYIGKYILEAEGNTDTVVLEQLIEVLNSDNNPTTSDPNFSITDSGEIKVNKNLNFAVVKLGTTLVLTLQITHGSEKGFSTLVISLPLESALKFIVPYYYATYNQDDTVLYDGQKIDVQTPFGATFKVDFLNENDNFDIWTSTYDIYTKIPLDNSVVLTSTDLVYPIQLTLGVNTAAATLVIKIGKKLVAPNFSEILYSARYTTNPSGDLVVDYYPNIQTDIAGTVRVTNLYEDNFSVTVSGDHYTLSVGVPLSIDTLKQSEIFVDLEASISGIPEAGVSLAKLKLVLPLQESDIMPIFSKPAYRGTYTKSDTGGLDSVKVDDSNPIEIISDNAELTNVVWTTDNANFKIERDSTDPRKWLLSVILNLDDETLSTKFQLNIDLKADFAASGKSSQTVLLIDLPAHIDELRTTPAFSETFYKSHIDENDHLQIDDNQIAIIGDYEDVTIVDIDEDDDLKSKFQLTHDKANQKWTISLISLFDPTTTPSPLPIRLSASLEKAPAKGKATLLIQLPPVQTVAKFDNPFYSCIYQLVENSRDTISCDPIKLSDAKSDVTAQNDNFQATKLTDGTVEIKVQSNLNSADLASTELIVILEAKLNGSPDTNTATLVIDLPLKFEVLVPQFVEKIYTATYQHSTSGGVDTVGLDNGGKISIKGVTDTSKGTITASREFADHFKITPSGDYWIVSLSTNLDDATLNEFASIVLQLNAVVDPNTASAVATLVIKLPKLSEQAFGFREHYYQGEYDEDDEFEFDETIEIDGDAEGVIVATEGDYKDYFVVNGGKVTLAKKLSDNDKKNGVITVDLVASSAEKRAVVPLIVEVKAGGGAGGSGGEGGDETAYIVVIALLAVLVVAGMIGTGIFYYRRQNRPISVEDAAHTPRFTKNSSISEVKHETILRRPTGLFDINILKTTPVDDIDEIEDQKPSPIDRRKSVIFDENVEEIEIDRVDDEETIRFDSDSDDNDNKQEEVETNNEAIKTNNDGITFL